SGDLPLSRRPLVGAEERKKGPLHLRHDREKQMKKEPKRVELRSCRECGELTAADTCPLCGKAIK
ncbi:hypothetical protein LCGC14_1906320, partial [marine sediment metagenome]